MQKRILIIDNDTILNKVNEKVLQSAAIASSVTITTNGQQALSYLENLVRGRQPLPEIIILDLQLPIVSGVDFVRAFRKFDPVVQSGIEIVVFTASTNTKARQQMSDLGVRHFIAKPYLLRGLIGAISSSILSRNTVA